MVEAGGIEPPYDSGVNGCSDNDLGMDRTGAENGSEGGRFGTLQDDAEGAQMPRVEELADSDVRDGCGMARQVDGSHGCRTCAERDSAFPSWSRERIREVLAACPDLPDGVCEAVANLIESSGG